MDAIGRQPARLGAVGLAAFSGTGHAKRGQERGQTTLLRHWWLVVALQ
jgi:hypothetical protein